MDYRSRLYPNFSNPLLFKPDRPLPKKVALVGAGTIGPDIGYFLKNALVDMELILVDVVAEPLKNAEKRYQDYVGKAIKKKTLTEDKGKKILENISYSQDYAVLKNCDLVIEAATESISLKKRIFKMVEEVVSPETIITSNTSSIPADRIFSEMKNPERTTVTHFFGPAHVNPAVEVITWEKVDQKIVDYLCWMFCITGKVPIVADGVIAFILDRIFDNWCNDAGYLLNDATASQIDKVAGEFVAAGPFFVLNFTNGNPIIAEANTLQMEEGEHYLPAKIFNSVDRWKTLRLGEPLEVPPATSKKIRDRLLGILFSQSFDILDRGIGTPGDLNLGCQVALAFKKGPLDIMRYLGESETKRIIETFQKDRPGFPGPLKPLATYHDFPRHLLIDVIEGVKIITIRRPQFMNAINDEVNNEILSAIQEDVSNNAIKGFVITGYGDRAFCAGAEIGKFPQMLGNAEASAKFARECSNLLLYIDSMQKPVVAAVNGLALGGGLEVAIRCHSIVASKNASFQFPEITLGILPGIGGCIVPYRKWPQAATVFHEMIQLGKSIKVQEAQRIGMVKKVADDYYSTIKAAIEEVNNLQGKTQRIPDGKVDLEAMQPIENPMAGKLALSREAVSIVGKTIKDAAAANTFQEALEIGYRGFGVIACTEAAKEGISAFQQRREPNYTK
jgi:3-hydroxyacyl-CoA dehydrogenase